jgi:predicted CXXCH cytochrome family protein
MLIDFESTEPFMHVSAMVRASVLVCAVLLSGVRVPLLAQAAEPKPAPSDSEKYVGADVCQGCHDDAYQSFAKSAHAATLKSAAPQTRGCEGCHGPGAAHVEAGGDPEKIWRYSNAQPDVINHRCTRCHETSLGEVHVKAHLTCLTCHSAHHGHQHEALLVKPVNQLCRGCHHH